MSGINRPLHPLDARLRGYDDLLLTSVFPASGRCDVGAVREPPLRKPLLPPLVWFDKLTTNGINRPLPLWMTAFEGKTTLAPLQT